MQVLPIEFAIPCFLHVNNRTAEKILQQFLLCGLKSCKTNKDKNCIIQKINNEIFGKSANNKIGQWQLPYGKNAFGDFNLLCPEAHEIIAKIKDVVTDCVANLPVDTQHNWLQYAILYWAAMDKLKSPRVFLYVNVCDFQNTVDEFGELDMEQTGRDGMTNYFHFLIAGHCSYFLEKYGNIYK